MTAPVLFLHGFAGAPAMWDAVVATSVGARRARCPVLPGHGLHPTHMDGDFDTAVDRLRSHLPEGPGVVVGYSLGGRLAVGMASRHPEIAAIAVGAHVGLHDTRARAERRAWDTEQANALRGEGVETFMRSWERLPIFATQGELPKAIRERQAGWRNGHTAVGLAWAMETLGLGSMPRHQHLARVELITGELDEKFTAHARGLDVRHRVASGVGHNVVLEAPEVVADALEELLAST